MPVCVCVVRLFFGLLLLFASINTHIIRSSLCIKTKLIAFIFSCSVHELPVESSLHGDYIFWR